MTEERIYDETTEQVDGGDDQRPSDKELNFAKLRQQYEAALAELEQLRPLKQREVLRQAGFDPDAPEGKSLTFAIEAGKVEADPEQIKQFAVNELGFQPKVALTETESRQVEAATRMEQVRQVTTSEAPPATTDDEIVEAEAEGDWGRAMALKMQRLAEMQQPAGNW